MRRSARSRPARLARGLPAWLLLGLGAAAAGAVHLAGVPEDLRLVTAAPRAVPPAPAAGAARLAAPTALPTHAAGAPSVARRSAAEPPGEPPPAARPLDPRIAGWIADLADDDVRGNASRAVRALRRAGAPAVAPLERALDSPDRQQRQLAATVLRALVAEPSDRLLAVTVEGLRYDGLPWDGRRYTPAGANEASGTRWLLRHARRVEEELARGLDSPDGQERFLCAFLLGRSGSPRAVGRTCEVLIPHLADNRVRGDAMMAAGALHGLGRLAMPYLVLAEAAADEQALDLLRLVQLDIARPPRTDADFEERKRMHRVTRVYRDPAVELDLGRSGLPSWGRALTGDLQPAR